MGSREIAQEMRRLQEQADETTADELRRAIPELEPHRHTAAARALLTINGGNVRNTRTHEDGNATMEWEPRGPVLGMGVPVIVMAPGVAPTDDDIESAAQTGEAAAAKMAVLMHSSTAEEADAFIVPPNHPSVRIRVINLHEWVRVMIRHEAGVVRATTYRTLRPDANIFGQGQ